MRGKSKRKTKGCHGNPRNKSRRVACNLTQTSAQCVMGALLLEVATFALHGTIRDV